ncbi:MAG TPA: transcriptional regulator [Nostocaceae cyanobacterium]|nr:transcriptional regulator [Nostocaceae cyanobacterium]
MTITLDRKTYGHLLEKYQPQVINSEDEYNRAIECIDELMDKEELSPEENSLLELLSILVEMYENSQFPLESSSPQEILLHLMDVRSLKQLDLVEIIGSKSLVSEIINGKRSISKAQAKALGAFFNVSPALFI